MGLSTILASALLAGTTPVPEPCRAIRGWDEVISGEKIRWIVLGEMHGTNEMPEIFADAVCLTSEVSPTVVALELPTADQPRIDAYLTSDGGLEAKRSLLEAYIWNGRSKDGRSSEAMFRLFERLHLLHKAGKVRAVIAFQQVKFKGPPSKVEYERAMAEVITANTLEGSHTLVLVGNVHARQAEVNFGGETYIPMAGHLPKEKTLTLNIANDGGLAWACGAPPECGPMTIGRKNGLHKRGVVLATKPGEAYGGQLFIGLATTASPPQATLLSADKGHK